MHRLSIETLPLWLVTAYLAGTVLLFFYGPFDWPISNEFILVLFLVFVVLALQIGFFLGLSGSDREIAPFGHWRIVFVIGGVSACTIIFPSAYIYTGRMPWEILQALADQRAAYENMLQRLIETEGGRGSIAIARAVTYPFVFAVVPLGILHWSRLGWLLRALLFATICSSVIFSFLRGTDREMADTLLVVGSAILVAIGRYCHAHKMGVFQLIGRGSVLAALLAGAIIMSLAITLFVDRKAARLDGATHEVCIGVDKICANDIAGSPGQELSRTDFGLAMLAAYLAQGYYGLSLALDMEFKSTFGWGHSALAARIQEELTGDESLYQRSYTYRLRDHGWSDEWQWSTAFTWIANDIGFPMTVFAIGFVAMVFGAAWKDAVFSRDDRATIVFCLLMQAMIYLPANNQLMQTLDAYFALVLWVSWWWVERFKSSIRKKNNLRAI